MKMITRIKRGLPLKQAVLDKLDEIVDYLRVVRPVQGPGVRISESASGLVISAARDGNADEEEDDALVIAGEGVRIDNGTASSVYVPGGTASAVPVNGATFTCLLEGGTSGGGGGSGGLDFPDWGMSSHNTGAASGLDIGNAALELSPNSVSVVLAANAWIYAFAEFEAATVDERRASAHVVVNGCAFKVASVYSNPRDDSMFGAGGGIVIPALAGSTVSFDVQAGQNPADFIHREGCVVYYV